MSEEMQFLLFSFIFIELVIYIKDLISKKLKEKLVIKLSELTYLLNRITKNLSNTPS